MNFKATRVDAGHNKEKIRIGAVSYLNTKPLIYGLENGLMASEVTLLIDYPSNIAKALLEDNIDIGLVPVAIIPELENPQIITDYCISSDGAVETVCIFSDVPMEEIQTVLLDYQSRTSVLLAQYLLKEFWKLNPVYKKAGPEFIQQIKGNTAAVLIGDRTFPQRNISAYCYDLGQAWKQHTGLPFVYAAWVSNKPMSKGFVERFNDANAYGLQRLDEVIAKYEVNPIDLKTYYTDYIQFRLSDAKREGLNLFLEKAVLQENILDPL